MIPKATIWIYRIAPLLGVYKADLAVLLSPGALGMFRKNRPTKIAKATTFDRARLV
jgi:hypothetical protein